MNPIQAMWYQKVARNLSYREKVIAPLLEARRDLPELLSTVGVPDGAQLFLCDCGPADVEDALTSINVLADDFDISAYAVIDVNRVLLDDVRHAVADRLDGPVIAVEATFETTDLADLARPPGSIPLQLFGATGMNYCAAEFGALIANMNPQGGLVAYQALLRNSIQSGLYESYETPEVDQFVFGPIAVGGGRREDFEADHCERSDRIEFAFRATRPLVLEFDSSTVVAASDRIVTAFSRRPDLQEAERFAEHILRERATTTRGVAWTAVGFVEERP